MRFVSIIFAITLTVAAALPVEDTDINTNANVRNSALEELVLGIIEEFRETMVTGSDDFPVLDPLEIDQLHLELDDLGLEGAHISATNAVVRDLSTFVIDDLSLNMISLLQQTYRLEVEGHIPALEIDAEGYDLSVTAVGMHIFGTGSAKIRIVEPRIIATLQIRLSILGGISIDIHSADVALKLVGFESQITGMFGNPIIEDFINEFLGNLIPEMVEFFADEISDVINSIIMGIGSIDLSSTSIGRDVAVMAYLPQLEEQTKMDSLTVKA